MTEGHRPDPPAGRPGASSERRARLMRARQIAVRRLARTNHWLVAGSVALTGVLSAAAANGFRGRGHRDSATPTASPTATPAAPAPADVQAPADSTSAPLQPPAQAPQPAPGPANVGSGGS